MMRARHVDRKLEQALLDHGLNPVLARVYAARELQTITDIRPGLDDLLRPDKMAGIEQAVDLLFNAIHQQAKLLVVADLLRWSKRLRGRHPRIADDGCKGRLPRPKSECSWLWTNTRDRIACHASPASW